MADFQARYTQLQQELGSSVNNLLLDESKEAINVAIEELSWTRFWFNEGEDTSITTVAAQDAYPIPVEMLEIDSIELTYFGHLYNLIWQTWDWYRDAVVDQTSETGPPINYAIYQNTIYLYPKPNDAFPVRLFGLKQLTPTPLVGPTDENVWTNAAWQMIRYRAKADLLDNDENNPQLASQAMQRFNDAKARLQRRTIGLRMRGQTAIGGGSNAASPW